MPVGMGYSFEEFCYEGDRAMGQKLSEAGTRDFVLRCGGTLARLCAHS